MSIFILWYICNQWSSSFAVFGYSMKLSQGSATIKDDNPPLARSYRVENLKPKHADTQADGLHCDQVRLPLKFISSHYATDVSVISGKSEVRPIISL